MPRRQPDIPTAQDLRWARETFGEREPRALFYRLTTSLMERALTGGRGVLAGGGAVGPAAHMERAVLRATAAALW